MGLTFEYSCPKCGTTYVGDMEDGHAEKHFEQRCDSEGCDAHFRVSAIVDISVRTEEA